MACSRDIRGPSGAERDRAGRMQLRLESPTPRLRCDRGRPTGASRNRTTASAALACGSPYSRCPNCSANERSLGATAGTLTVAVVHTTSMSTSK